jgi:octaprenyl-diphosphate synthase
VLHSPARVISDTNKQISQILQGKMPILKQLQRYVVASGGKRIRPLFQYYLGKSYRLDDRELIRLGSLLEIVHAASLLHDDVVDGAEERRSKPTGAKIFGNKAVVLGGDHLLSSGLKALSNIGNSQYMNIFTDAIKALSAAELLQMQQHFDLKTSPKTHAEVVDGKTAVLFRAAGALVAVMRNEGDFYRSETAELGLAFGRFFQYRDDYLDYFDSARLKKRGLQDFSNGIVTQPLHYLLASANKPERARIEALWRRAKAGDAAPALGEIMPLMAKHKVAERCGEDLGRMQREILAGLTRLPEKAPRERIRTEFEKILAVAPP